VRIAGVENDTYPAHLMQKESPTSPRRLWLPTATVAVALVVSLAVPLMIRWAEAASEAELRREIYPLRSHLQSQRSWLQSGIAARVGYEASGNPILLQRAAEWRDSATSVQPAIDELIGQAPDAVVAAYEEFERLQEVLELERTADVPADEMFGFVPRVSALQDSLMMAYSAVDVVLASEIASREAELDEMEVTGMVSNIVLGILGLLAILSVVRLARAEMEARAAAERATDLRDQVLSIVSHDLRNPLSTIGLTAGFLLEQAEHDGSTDKVRHLGIISRATKSMNRMIQDLLDIAQIESGRLAIEREPTDPRALLNEAVSVLRPVVEEQGIALRIEIDTDLPTILVDFQRTVQMLSNLVGNAVKFTPTNGSITLRARRDDDRVWIEVADTGVGIPPEQIQHLFDRFWQASRTDRRGIGLGLPIVKHLAEAQGGTIEVSSVVGQGSSFRFSTEVLTPTAGGADPRSLHQQSTVA
jgi:signal transduction histidine kinase